MARLSRLSLPGIAQHVIQRGNNRQVCFFTEEDYPVYLDKLKEIRDAVNKIWVLGGEGTGNPRNIGNRAKINYSDPFVPESGKNQLL